VIDDSRLTELCAKQSIHDALMRYFRGVDRCDVELIDSLFHPDAIAEHGPVKYRGDQVGTEISAAMASRFDSTFHTVANELVDVAGDYAFSETYAINHHLFRRDGILRILKRAIRYIDRFENRDGQWKIAHRIVVCEWDQIDEVREQSDLPQYAEASRSRADPVFSQKI
jgi:ketosteroid isomerase-like protein